MARTVSIPDYREPVIMPDGTMNPNWYVVFKFIETLQPLSDIPAIVPPSPLTPGSTSASITTRAVVLTQSGTGNLNGVIGWNSPSNQSLYDSFANIQSVIDSFSTNDLNLSNAVGALSTRTTAAENKINQIISAI